MLTSNLRLPYRKTTETAVEYRGVEFAVQPKDMASHNGNGSSIEKKGRALSRSVKFSERAKMS